MSSALQTVDRQQQIMDSEQKFPFAIGDFAVIIFSYHLPLHSIIGGPQNLAKNVVE